MSFRARREKSFFDSWTSFKLNDYPSVRSFHNTKGFTTARCTHTSSIQTTRRALSSSFQHGALESSLTWMSPEASVQTWMPANPCRHDKNPRFHLSVKRAGARLHLIAQASQGKFSA